MNEKLVSIIIPTRDRGELLRRALESVIAQHYSNWEVIIIDDGSTPSLKLPMLDKRIKLFRNESSKGVCAARNKGLRLAQGKYICFLDDDDEYMPDKLTSQVKHLDENPGVDIVFSNILCKTEEREYLWLNNDYVFNVKNNVIHNRIHNNAALITNKVAANISFDERSRKWVDAQFFIMASLKYKTSYLPGIAASWNRDDRKDRVSQLGRSAMLTSLRNLIEHIEDELEVDEELKLKMYGKLAYLALRTNNFQTLIMCAGKINLYNCLYGVISYYLSVKRSTKI